MNKYAFFHNFIEILTYATIGTMLNAVIISILLIICQNVHAIKTNFTAYEHMTFSAIVSSVDPVAVIAIMESMHVNQDLFNLAFGESTLNDGVAIVLYDLFKSLGVLQSEGYSVGEIVGLGIAKFLVSVLGAICLSTLLTFLVCFLTRFTHTIATFEPLIFILTGIICYALSDCLLFSGVIGVIICALILVRYAEFNVDKSSLKSFETCIHMISHSFEGLLFFDMGIQFTLIFIKNIREIDWFYCLIAIPITFVARFVAILIQTIFINVSRNKVGKPIKMTDQIILLFCGLRGGISFSLARAWNMGTIFKKEDQAVLATSFLIVFTVYCYGCLMRPLIIGLGIETEAEHKPEEMIGCTTLGYSASTVQNYVQTLLGQNSSNAFKRFLVNLDHQLQNVLLRTPLFMDRELLEQAEQVKQLQQQLIISRFQ